MEGKIFSKQEIIVHFIGKSPFDIEIFLYEMQLSLWWKADIIKVNPSEPEPKVETLWEQKMKEETNFSNNGFEIGSVQR